MNRKEHIEEGHRLYRLYREQERVYNQAMELPDIEGRKRERAKLTQMLEDWKEFIKTPPDDEVIYE